MLRSLFLAHIKPSYTTCTTLQQRSDSVPDVCARDLRCSARGKRRLDNCSGQAQERHAGGGEGQGGDVGRGLEGGREERSRGALEGDADAEGARGEGSEGECSEVFRDVPV